MKILKWDICKPMEKAPGDASTILGTHVQIDVDGEVWEFKAEKTYWSVESPIVKAMKNHTAREILYAFKQHMEGRLINAALLFTKDED